MGCCTSTPAPSKSTNDEISTPISPESDDKSDKTSSQQPEIQKKHSHKKNKHPHQSEHGNKENSKSYDSLNLDGTESYEKMDRDAKKLALEEEQKRLEQLQQNALDDQISRQRAKSFIGLYQIFQSHTFDADQTKMDIDGLTSALAHFGMIIDTNKTLQKFVFSKFDIDNAKEIDYNDFMSTMSSLIGTKNEDALLLMFQIFDNDEDGYLNLDDMARVLLAQNQIAVVTTGQQGQTTVTYTKNQCLKQARNMIEMNENETFKDNKISFDEFMAMMMKMDTKDMMLENMVQPSVSVISVDAAKNRGTPQANDATPSYAYTPKQISVQNSGDETLLEE